MNQLVDQRRKAQLEFLASKQELEAGNINDLPLRIEEIIAINQYSDCVEEVYSSGLTAVVYKIRVNNKHYNLKKKRENILVKNIDGQTSFLNEIQRRKNFYRFKSVHPEEFSHIVDTIYASLNYGFILSEWIEGEILKSFDYKHLNDIFKTHLEIEKKGLFECDLSLNNLIVDSANNIRFFDFGYMYPYNPLIHYNSDGKELPIFHLAERLESRSLMQYLMDIEANSDFMLQTYQNTKIVATETYILKLKWLEQQNADKDVIDWHRAYIRRWEYALKSIQNLMQIYDLESFRSYVLDVHDDISGKSCTTNTLKKISKILAVIRENFDGLQSQNGLFWGDEFLDKNSLLAKYQQIEKLAINFQIAN